MTAINRMMDALYQVFTTTILFPDQDTEKDFRVLCRFGLVEHVAQGHAMGYRITPKGYAEAMRLWGHDKR